MISIEDQLFVKLVGVKTYFLNTLYQFEGGIFPHTHFMRLGSDLQRAKTIMNIGQN